jgi:integrase
MLKNSITTGIYLDTRRSLKDDTYPVKLRVTYKRETQFFKTKFSLTEQDFKTITTQAKPRGELKDLKKSLSKIETDADAVIEKLRTFSFDLFKKNYFSDNIDESDLFAQFNHKIKILRVEERIGSANTYLCALNSIKDFYSKATLDLHNVTPQFLQEYENWMSSHGNSLTTVGIYLRCVRHLFNRAIEEGIVDIEYYPFGKNKYQIPQPQNIKKALTLNEIKLLYEHEAENESLEQMYRDMWFFSYLCNGMNMKDICMLRYKDIQGKHIYFRRQKTKFSNRSSKPIDVVIIDQSKVIIDRWSTKDKEPDNFVFPFLKKDQSAEKMLATVKQVTKMTNKYIRQIALKVGIDKNITTYWARHSYATVLKRSNVGVSFISEALGHKNIKTTETYLDSFEDDEKMEIAKKLIDFKK